MYHVGRAVDMATVSEGMIERPDDRTLTALCNELRANSFQVGSDGKWPDSQLRWCGQRGVFRWFLPEAFGGYGWNGEETIEGFLQLSAACLTTTFVLTQLTGACRRIANCDNGALQERLLPALADGRALCTVAISHLTTSRRHLAQPALSATETDDGLALNGFSPWVTAAAHVDSVVTGAELADGRQALAVVPFSAAGVSVGESAALVGLSGSKTGIVKFENVRVDRGQLLGEPIENVMQTGVGASSGGLQTSTLALGLASAAIEFVRDESSRRPQLASAADQLQTDLDGNLVSLRALAAGEGDHSACSPADLRVKSNSLVLRATQSALVAAKGAGFVKGHPAGRWCQEALFFLVWSCPQPVSNANLCEFARIE
jgi:alkylation response protein AidB-like acyl-CoA dehydrogenase